MDDMVIIRCKECNKDVFLIEVLDHLATGVMFCVCESCILKNPQWLSAERRNEAVNEKLDCLITEKKFKEIITNNFL